MIKLVHVVRGLLFLAGVIAISVVGYSFTKAGNPGLGHAITYGVASLIVLLLCVQWLLVLRRRRALRKHRQTVAAPLKPFSIQETANYRHSVEAVWNLIRPAESAALLGDSQRAFSVPGTPVGVGEQQCFIGRDGTTSILEVIAEEPPRWAATKIVSPADSLDTRLTYRLDPTETNGCVLTYGMDFRAPGTAKWSMEFQQQWRANARHFLDRVDQTLTLQDPLPAQE